MRWSMKKSSSLGMPMSPQEISKKYKRQSLGMSKTSPSSSTKISGHLSRHYIFIASYTMCNSWSISFLFYFILFAVINGLCGRETRSAFSCEYSYSSLIFVEYYCLAIAILLAPIFHAYLVQSLLVFFSYICLALWSLFIFIYGSCSK
jgi:hypothetical protein